MNGSELKKFVEENPKLVTMRDTGNGLFVLKYSKTVFYNNLWNDFLENCRGLIVDFDFNVIQRPFQKIYNYGIEKNAPIIDPSTLVTAYRKVNGFMVAATWHNNDVLVSTTGSTTSDFVNMARELMNLDKFKSVLSKHPTTTFLFEAVHRNDPHIIAEKEGLYLLGHREKTWDSDLETSDIDQLAEELEVYAPKKHRMSLGELLTLVKTVEHEGFVFYTADGISSKVKSPFYLVSKWLSRNPNTDKIMSSSFKQQVDEEYYPLVDNIRKNIEMFTTLDEQSRLNYIRDYLSTTVCE